MSNVNITLENIMGAERLLGLSYSDEERAQMVGNLEGQISSAVARRGVHLENSDPMALRFDPRLPGFSMPSSVSRLVLSDITASVPKDTIDLAYAPVAHLSHWLHTNQISSRQLVDIYLERIAALNPTLACFATVTPEIARAEAEAADSMLAAGISLGPLHGIPYGLKDLFDTRDVVTGWGAEPYRDRVPQHDAHIVTKLRAAGAVLLGKTTLGALAYNDIWYGGRTRNPWNTEEGSSGSSAGSGSATAAGLCGFSIGTETLGSITSPSQRCGTTGLRPTFGRVGRTGGMALCWSLDKIGPICRSVEDTAIVLSVLNGPDPGDLCSIDAGFQFDASAVLDGLRLGFLADAFGDGATRIDHAALEAAQDLGVEVVEVSLPDLPYNALINTLYAEAAAAFEHLTLDNLDDTLTWQEDGAWPNTFRKARFLSAVDHVQLDRLRFKVMQALDGMFQGIDALIGPFMTGPMLVASNFTGHPCLHLRAGFDNLTTRGAASLGSGKLSTGDAAEEGDTHRVPQGISLWGRLFDEGRILNLGQALEAKLDVAHERPDLG